MTAADAATADGHNRPRGSTLLTVLGGAITALAGVGVWQVSEGSVPGYVLTGLAHGAIYLAALWLVLSRRISALGFWIIIAAAISMRLVAVWTPHEIITTDALRYVWDGRIQWHGWNPYLYFPAAPELEYLRDAEIYPNINQKERAVTIYPPFAEMLFLAGYLISDSVWGQKIVMLAMEAISIGALIGILTTWGLPRERVIIYAWHPLPVWEFVAHAHLDAAAVAFMLLAVWAILLKRQGLAGALLSLATLIKYFPVVIIPALWKRWDWRAPTVFVIVAAALYLPYAWGAGANVIGFLGQHLDNEGYGQGWGFHVVWMLRDFGYLPFDVPAGRAYVLAALCVLAGLAAIAFWGRRRSEIHPGMLVLLAAAFVWLTSPHYPWYFGWIVPFLCLYLSPAALFMTLASFLLYWPRLPGGVSWTELYGVVYFVPLVIAVVLGLRMFFKSRTATASL